jgi:hypothetical protein
MKIRVFIWLLAVILTACSARLKTVFDPAASFANYKTFCWLQGCQFEIKGPAYLQDSLIRERIKTALILEMEKKGLRYNNDNPDLMVAFAVTVENEKVTNYHRNNLEDFPYSITFPQREEVYLTKGSMIISLVDRSTSRVVWQSTALSYLETTPDLSTKNIRKGVTFALRDFPPEGKQP